MLVRRKGYTSLHDDICALATAYATKSLFVSADLPSLQCVKSCAQSLVCVLYVLLMLQISWK
jgi:hypothetical protein